LNKITNHKPRVCYLRGSYLNPYEMQYLEPLKERFSITVAYPKSHRYDIRSIQFPKFELACLDYGNGIIPRSIFRIPVPNILKIFGFEEVFFGIKKILKNFDLLHVPEQTFFFSWQAVNYMDNFNCKIVVTQDEVNPFWYAHKPWMARRAEQVRKRANFFIARTERAKQALICEGVESRRIKVIGHGVDTTRFTPKKRDMEYAHTLGIAPNRIVILFVGRLVWTKGLWALAISAAMIKADPELSSFRPIFLVVGDGPERRAFEKWISTLGVSAMFKLMGHQSYDKLDTIYQLADIFALPSISTRTILEQFGISLIEAMATGIPVVSTHCGAIDEVIGDAGIIVQPNDGLRLYESLKRLILDSKLRKLLGNLGRKRVINEFSNKKIAGQLSFVYENVLDKE
jgi:glycosyltransferase involved in cell wall biosynthesis